MEAAMIRIPVCWYGEHGRYIKKSHLINHPVIRVINDKEQQHSKMSEQIKLICWTGMIQSAYLKKSQFNKIKHCLLCASVIQYDSSNHMIGHNIFDTLLLMPRIRIGDDITQNKMRNEAECTDIDQIIPVMLLNGTKTTQLNHSSIKC